MLSTTGFGGQPGAAWSAGDCRVYWDWTPVLSYHKRSRLVVGGSAWHDSVQLPSMKIFLSSRSKKGQSSRPGQIRRAGYLGLKYTMWLVLRTHPTSPAPARNLVSFFFFLPFRPHAPPQALIRSICAFLSSSPQPLLAGPNQNA